ALSSFFLYTTYMKLIIAQGNPGTQYAQTRHNVGFLALDYYADKHGVQFQPKPKFYADIAEVAMGDVKVQLVKPTTFYNDTGKSARALADFYKVDTSDILVIHDELMLPFGTIRTRVKGSDAGNNGIKSLNAHLGENYARIRVGTANDIATKQDAYDFVLSNFTANEAGKLQNDIFPKVSELVDDFINDQHTAASHKVLDAE
ncbi:MAG: peptidyl-tRNA hydrolase, family, partial [Patescibacteria group bacterium]|nr:peptidyl-tRNA hydrolase, family [Patescibacteria group bacterium]